MFMMKSCESDKGILQQVEPFWLYNIIVRRWMFTVRTQQQSELQLLYGIFKIDLHELQTWDSSNSRGFLILDQL